MPTTNFWLLHAAFALASGLCFVAFKFIAGHHLEAEGSEIGNPRLRRHRG